MSIQYKRAKDHWKLQLNRLSRNEGWFCQVENIPQVLLSITMLMAIIQAKKTYFVVWTTKNLLEEIEFSADHWITSLSMVWSKVQACFATLKPLVHCLIFLICSFRLVLNDLFDLYPQRVPVDIIRHKSLTPPTLSPEELVRMFFSWADPTNNQSFVVLPYIRGITEPLTRILKSHDIRVTNKPIKRLQHEFPVPKFQPWADDQCNVVYKIPCGCCPWSYIGETKRSFSTRRKEHTRNIKQCTKASNVAKHAWTLDHTIDLNNAEIIDKGNNCSVEAHWLCMSRLYI